MSKIIYILPPMNYCTLLFFRTTLVWILYFWCLICMATASSRVGSSGPHLHAQKFLPTPLAS